MIASQPNLVDISQANTIQRKLVLESKIRSAASWFFWIAGLSLLNTVIYLTGSSINFVIGFGVTQIIDGVVSAIREDMGQGGYILLIIIIGFALDLALAGIFVVFGLLSRTRRRWAIFTGMVLYAMDGIVLLLFKEFFGAAFHAWALFSIAGSLPAIKELAALEAAQIYEPGGYNSQPSTHSPA